MTAERLMLWLGVRPEQYRDFAALRGDPADHLPGVHGIGPRTAEAIVAALCGPEPAAGPVAEPVAEPAVGPAAAGAPPDGAPPVG